VRFPDYEEVNSRLHGRREFAAKALRAAGQFRVLKEQKRDQSGRPSSFRDYDAKKTGISSFDGGRSWSANLNQACKRGKANNGAAGVDGMTFRSHTGQSTGCNGTVRLSTQLRPVSYRYPPRVAKENAEIIVQLPKPVRDQTSSLTRQASASTKMRIAGSFMPLIYTAAAPRRRAPCGQPFHFRAMVRQADRDA
jgi:hypothetical protein